MMIRAICLSSEDIPRTVGSIRSRTYGPITIPAASIPIILGSFKRLIISAAESPTIKIMPSEKA